MSTSAASSRTCETNGGKSEPYDHSYGAHLAVKPVACCYVFLLLFLMKKENTADVFMFTLSTSVIMPLCYFNRFACERAKRIESCAVIGYPSGQDGALPCSLGINRCVPQENKCSFIDQACWVKMTEHKPRFFASLWTLTPSRPIRTQKTELDQYPTILTSHLVTNGTIFT